VKPLPGHDDYGSRFATGISHGVSTIKTLTASIQASSTALSGVCYAAAVPFSLLADWSNPRLTNDQKWVLTGYDVGTAAIGIVGGIVITNVWNPVGWVGGVICIGYGALCIIGNVAITSAFEKGNGY